MGTVNELIKYKEMMDQGVISSEEFDNIKMRLLGESQMESVDVFSDAAASDMDIRQAKNKGNKRLLVVLGSILLAVGLVFGIWKFNAWRESVNIKKAFAEEISPIMADYGVDDFKIKSLGNIECKDYSQLSDKDKFELLHRLEKIDSFTTRDGEEHSGPSSCNIYISPTGYYYTVSTLEVVYLGHYSTAGLYYSDGGSRYCVYETEN